MIERQQELKRRYHRKKKMTKLKAKLTTATGEDREKILYKIKRLSPWWTEASLTQKTTTAKSTEAKEKKERAPKSTRAPAGPRGPKADKN
jgi:hypothetical protein